MQILLADAKIMVDNSTEIAPSSTPIFQSFTNKLAEEIALIDIDDLMKQLGCSMRIAVESHLRFKNFLFATRQPAIFVYNGQAYKHLKACSLRPSVLAFAQKHLWITSFMYGLLRPLDGIVSYRVEPVVKLDVTGDKPLSQFWRDILTGHLIDSVNDDDGILLHLSTEEYEHLFHWHKVSEKVKIVQPLFYVRDDSGKLKIQAVWAKTCRGAMVRYILENRIIKIDDLYDFSYEGFEYDPTLGDSTHPHFVRNTLRSSL